MEFSRLRSSILKEEKVVLGKQEDKEAQMAIGF